MPNLEVLRAVQHSWPGYCWPLLNGNGFPNGMIPTADMMPKHDPRKEKIQNHNNQESNQLVKNSRCENDRLSPVDSHHHGPNFPFSSDKKSPLFPKAPTDDMQQQQQRVPMIMPPAFFNPLMHGMPRIPTGFPPVDGVQCSDLMRSLAAKYNNNNERNNILPRRMSPTIPTSSSENVYNSHPSNNHPDIKNHINNNQHNINRESFAKELPPSRPIVNNTRGENPQTHFTKTESNYDALETNFTSSRKRSATNDECPLDLSSSPAIKRLRPEEGSSFSSKSSSNLEDIMSWSVENVYTFIKSIDVCAEYADVFREQSIDGSCLSLLTENHLTSKLSMKLGPALKLKLILAANAPPSSTCSACCPLRPETSSPPEGTTERSSHVFLTPPHHNSPGYVITSSTPPIVHSPQNLSYN